VRKLLLLRPEPGLSASAGRAREMGLDVVLCPLFRFEPVEWAVPDPADYDALLLTSANSVRHGGSGLSALSTLPVHAVGAATAAAAEEAGLRVESVGRRGVADGLAALPGSLRLLHLAGEDRTDARSPHRIDARSVYRSSPIADPGLPSLEGLVVAVHSPRAGARLAELADTRRYTAIAAISAAAAEACGGGWERVEAAERPDDPSLLALAAMLCHTSPPR
jgi:uroporphyrinogen-III synthase